MIWFQIEYRNDLIIFAEQRMIGKVMKNSGTTLPELWLNERKILSSKLLCNCNNFDISHIFSSKFHFHFSLACESTQISDFSYFHHHVLETILASQYQIQLAVHFVTFKIMSVASFSNRLHDSKHRSYLPSEIEWTKCEALVWRMDESGAWIHVWFEDPAILGGEQLQNVAHGTKAPLTTWSVPIIPVTFRFSFPYFSVDAVFLYSFRKLILNEWVRARGESHVSIC